MLAPSRALPPGMSPAMSSPPTNPSSSSLSDPDDLSDHPISPNGIPSDDDASIKENDTEASTERLDITPNKPQNHFPTDFDTAASMQDTATEPDDFDDLVDPPASQQSQNGPNGFSTLHQPSQKFPPTNLSGIKRKHSSSLSEPDDDTLSIAAPARKRISASRPSTADVIASRSLSPDAIAEEAVEAADEVAAHDDDAHVLGSDETAQDEAARSDVDIVEDHGVTVERDKNEQAVQEQADKDLSAPSDLAEPKAAAPDEELDDDEATKVDAEAEPEPEPEAEVEAEAEAEDDEAEVSTRNDDESVLDPSQRQTGRVTRSGNADPATVAKKKAAMDALVPIENLFAVFRDK